MFKWNNDYFFYLLEDTPRRTGSMVGRHDRLYCLRIPVKYLQLGHIKVWDRSQWQRGLRCRSTAARRLRSWGRIPQGAWMFFCCVCYQVQISATSWYLVQRSPTDCGASLCVIKKPRERGGHSPLWTADSMMMMMMITMMMIIILITLEI
jgi:hypothetical protein